MPSGQSTASIRSVPLTQGTHVSAISINKPASRTIAPTLMVERKQKGLFFFVGLNIM